jgi:hypothetical protein
MPHASSGIVTINLTIDLPAPYILIYPAKVSFSNITHLLSTKSRQGQLAIAQN